MFWIIFIAAYAAAAVIGFSIAKFVKKVKLSSAILIGISWPLIIFIIPLALVSIFVESVGDAWDDLL